MAVQHVVINVRHLHEGSYLATASPPDDPDVEVKSKTRHEAVQEIMNVLGKKHWQFQSQMDNSPVMIRIKK